MVTVNSFILAYPEFASADSNKLTSQLAIAELQVGDHWGSERDAIVMLQLAANLATSPSGRNARLNPDKVSTYQKQLESLQKAHACAFSRIG